MSFRFAGKQVHASVDDGSVNHALVRDLDEETDRLERFGAELENEWSCINVNEEGVDGAVSDTLLI